MPAVRDFLFPDLGEGLTEGEIVAWLVAVGDRVGVDQPIAEVSTEKAAVQVPVPFAGVVVALHGEPGGIIRVGAPLISIDVGAPVAAGSDSAPPPGLHDEPGTVRSAAPGSGNVLVGYGTASEGGRRRPRARSAGAAGGAGPGIANGHAPADRTVPAASAAPPAPTAAPSGGPDTARGAAPASSPLVRRRAALAGVDLAAIRPTGPNGSVSQGDLDRHLQANGAAAAGQAATAAASPVAAAGSAPAFDARPGGAAPGQDGERIRLTGVRRITAERLGQSHHDAPDATAWLSADAGALLALRDLLNARQSEVRVTPLAVVLRLCAAALRRHPSLNAHVDPATGDTVLAARINLGVAVQAPHGLLVPVIRDAQRLSVLDIAAELNRLAGLARAGRLAQGEMSGSTFTISNFGAFGVDGGSAIINPPEAAILGMGRIADRPWVVGGALAVRPVVQLSLVFDHRACDGGTAGGFLRLLGDLVEHPELLVEEG